MALTKKLNIFISFIIIPLSYLGLQFIFITSYPMVLMDEPWYSNTAYNIAYYSQIENTLVGRAAEDLFFYPLILSQWFKLTGTGLLQARIFSILVGLLCVYFFINILKKCNVPPLLCYFSTLLMIFSNTFFVIARRARPEIIVICLILMAILIYLNYINSKKNKHLMLLGIVLALSFWTHPNMSIILLISTLALCLSFIRRKAYSAILYVGLGELIVFACGFIGWAFFKENSLIECIQNLAGSNRVGTNFSFFENLFTFLKNYSLGWKRLYITIFELIFLIFPLFVIKRFKFKSIGSISLISLFCLLSFFTPFFRTAFCIFSIISILLFTICFNHYKTNKLNVLAFICLGSLYLCNNLIGDIFVLYKARSNASYNNISKYLGIIPNNLNTNVMGPIECWYALPNSTYYASIHKYVTQHFYDTTFNYIILREYDDSQSPTTMSTEKVYYGYSTHYTKLLNQLNSDSRYQKISSQLFNGYGTLSIWQDKRLLSKIN